MRLLPYLQCALLLTCVDAVRAFSLGASAHGADAFHGLREGLLGGATLAIVTLVSALCVRVLLRVTLCWRRQGVPEITPVIAANAFVFTLGCSASLGAFPLHSGNVEVDGLAAGVVPRWIGGIVFASLISSGCAILSHYFPISSATLVRRLGRVLQVAISVTVGAIVCSATDPGVAQVVTLVLLAAAFFLLLRGPLAERCPPLPLGYGAAVILVVGGASHFLNWPAATANAQVSATTVRPVSKVILLSVDTLRADALSCYGADSETPHIDAMARDSWLFENAISSSSWTLPAFGSILTGLSPWVHQLTSIHARLDRDIVTLPERLRARGYDTHAIVCNPILSHESEIFQGFNRVTRFPNDPLGSSFGCQLAQAFASENYSTDNSTHTITQRAIDYLDNHHERSFFLWLHYFDPHMPYAPAPHFAPQESRVGPSFDDRAGVRSGRFFPTSEEIAAIKNLYHAEVAGVDAGVGQVIAKLRELGIYDETLIVFVSDHGEEHWDHGGFEHGHALHREVIHVPLMFKLPQPGKAQPAAANATPRRFQEFVSTTAIAPTVFDLCIVDYDPTLQSEGSLAPIFQSQPLQSRPVISSGCVLYEDQDAIYWESQKYVRKRITERELLFDLSHDHDEQHSIAGEGAKLDTARELWRLLRQQAKDLRQRLSLEGQQRGALTSEQLRRLESLGYTR